MKDKNPHHKSISEAIYQYYLIMHGRKPDSSEYAAAYKTFSRFMDVKNDGLRYYSLEEMVLAFNRMRDAGLIVSSPFFLNLEHLVSSFVDGNVLLQQIVSRRLRILEESRRVGDGSDVGDPPAGW